MWGTILTVSIVSASLFIIEKYYRKKELIELQTKLLNIDSSNKDLINECKNHYDKIDKYLINNNMK
tara:strand:- start:2201 stop:2398 length:198 start_codon:yes stop_codon:yes gene_type:complete